MSASGARHNPIYGWTARRNGAWQRIGRWHAHTVFGRPLCPATAQRSGGFSRLARKERPPQDETCPACWKLPDEGTPA